MNDKPIRIRPLKLLRRVERIPEKPQEIISEELRATVEGLQGKYCNVAIIHHTKREFVFDYVLRIANSSIFISRIVTSPEHAKDIHRVLGTNIEKYENTFGKIEVAQKQSAQGNDKKVGTQRLIRRRRPL